MVFNDDKHLNTGFDTHTTSEYGDYHIRSLVIITHKDNQGNQGN